MTRIVTAASMCLISACAWTIVAVAPVHGEEIANPTPGPGSTFDPTQTYEVFFSLHPREVDHLSNVRLLGTNTIGPKTFLRFQALLNNQRGEGFLDLQTVTAIFPIPKPLAMTAELMLERQPIDHEKVKEVRSETIREIIRQAPSMPMPPKD